MAIATALSFLEWVKEQIKYLKIKIHEMNCLVMNSLTSYPLSDLKILYTWVVFKVEEPLPRKNLLKVLTHKLMLNTGLG